MRATRRWTRRFGLARRVLDLLAVAATLALLGTAVAQDAERPPPAITNLTVDATQGPEGASYTFKATIDNPTGSLLNHRWDFGDGTVVESVRDVTTYRHRYRDQGTYAATLEVGLPGGASAQRTITVTVDNVPPTIASIARSAEPLAGSAVTFTASVVDPGDDALSLTWNFGDGATPVTRRGQRHVEHTYDRDGQYLLTLTVTDGDGGEATHQETVFVGAGMSFDAIGVVAPPDASDGTPTLMGIRVTEVDGRLQTGSGSCFVAISSRGLGPSFEPGIALALTAAFPAGLEVGTYPIAVEANRLPIPIQRAGEQELRAPGVFFAGLAEIAVTDEVPTSTEFHGTGGSLVIHRFDGERVEATFEATFEESFGVLDLVDTDAGSVFPPARTASVSGRFVHDVSRTVLGAQGSAGSEFGNWYLCDSSEPLEVVGHDMGPAAPDASNDQSYPENRPWERNLYASGDAQLDFTLHRPVRASTVNDRTVIVEIHQTTYATTGEPFLQVHGTVVPLDDHSFRFVPDTDLLPGVIYRVTLKSGPNGVRGLNGELLAEDYTWRFATRVELAALTADVFQVSRNAMLVARKPTLTRVHALWPKNPDLPDESQVESFSANVSVHVDGQQVYVQKRGIEVIRPDLFTDEDRRLATNSINFFDWRPTQTGGTSTLRVTLEASDQPQPVPERTTSEPIALRHWDRSPTLTFDYHYLQIYSWRDGVPEELMRSGDRLMQDDATFVTQNFPVVSTLVRPRGELSVPTPRLPLETLEGGDGCSIPYANLRAEDVTDAQDFADAGGTASLNDHLAWEVHRATRGSTADVVVAVLPHEVSRACGLWGVLVAFSPTADYVQDVTTRRVILMSSRALGSRVLAHELGHFFGLCHPDDQGEECGGTRRSDIEGFRIDLDGGRGWNKSSTDGNGEGSLTLELLEDESGSIDAPTFFITNDHYARLFDTLARRDITRRPPEAPVLAVPSDVGAILAQASPAPTTNWLVNGIVSADGEAALLSALRPTPQPRSVDDPAPTHRLVVVDRDGRELDSVGIELLVAHVVDGEDQPQGTTFFEGVLPRAPTAHAVLLTTGDSVIARIDRSDHAPEVALRRDGRTLTWEASDRDGDALVFDLDYSPDGDAWTPIMAGTQATSTTLPEALETGPTPSVRVVAYDGFHATTSVLTLDLERTLRIVAAMPMEGEAIDPGAAPWITFNGDVEDTGPDAITLRTADGAVVEATARLMPGGRGLMLLPNAPLEPGAYTLTVAGVRGAHGYDLAGATSWLFTVATAEAIEAEAAPAVPPGAPAPEIPETCAGIARSVVVALLPAVHEIEEVSEDEGCRVAVRVSVGVPQARGDVEGAIVRGRYRFTGNAQEGEAIVVGFQSAEYGGEARIEATDAGTRIVLAVVRR